LNIINQILLSGISPEQLIELFRPMAREELRLVIAEQDEKLLSPSKTCEIFIPAITKATLSSWTKQGLLKDHRYGSRVYYLKSEVLAASKKLKKHKSIYKN